MKEGGGGKRGGGLRWALISFLLLVGGSGALFWHLSSSPSGKPTMHDPVRNANALRLAAAKLDPELLREAPEKYEPMKNPCWRSSMSNGKLRCLPYFYVSGFHTGSGALARRLAVHPNVVMDAGRLSSWGPTWGYWSEYRNKMSDYLDGIGVALPAILKDPKQNVVMDGSMSTFALYWASSGKVHRAFSTAAVGCWKKCDSEHGGSSGIAYELCMESKCLPEGRQADLKAAADAGLPYSDLHLPMLMRALYGNRNLPKFVFLLRNPVDRIYSAFFGTKSLRDKYGGGAANFTQFVAEQVKAYRRCSRNHTEVDCILRFESLGMDEEKVFFHCDQILRGMYAIYLEIWFRYFPRSSFLIINSNEYFQDSHAVTIRALQFLDLPVPDPGAFAALEGAGPRVSNVESAGWIPEGARRVLSKLYEPHNIALAELLGDKSWLRWNVDKRDNQVKRRLRRV